MGDRTEAGSNQPRCLRAARRVLLLGVVAGLAVVALGLTATRPSGHGQARAAVPAFRLPPLTPGSPDLDSRNLNGRVTVVTFWASWCVPCRSELPRLARDFAHRDVSLVGIDTNDNRSEAVRFLDSVRVRLRSGFDDQGQVAAAFHLYGLPSAVVLTPSGLIAAQYLGPVSTKVLATAVRLAGAG
jgi:thiol-disulfide isomerase/thioredoxin